MNLPNIWGDGGALFAFSGMDGGTEWRYPLVGSTLGSGRGFVFHTSSRPVLRFGIRTGDGDCTGDPGSEFDAVSDDVVGGDVIISHFFAGDAAVRLEYVFADHNTVLARATRENAAAAHVFLESRPQQGGSWVSKDALLQSSGPDHYALGCSSSEAWVDAALGRLYAPLAPGESVIFAWAYSVNGPQEAARLTPLGLREKDFQAVVDDRLRFYRSLPPPGTSDPDLARAYYKCASVMKVNCCSPQDRIPVGWTTPDRWPHRHMWIWDSAFHAIGLRHISHKWAEDAIKAVLALQRDDGFIPHMMTPDGSEDSDIIQPPVLAWGAWKVYESSGNLDFLAYVYPRVAKMLDYDCTARDTDSNGLSEWESGGASGMDNSPRFDQPLKDAVDLNCYIVNDMRHLALIARDLGDEEDARDWERQADERARRINGVLWDPETRFYYDNSPDGSLVRIKTEAGLTPLFAGVCDQGQAAALVEHLTNPDEFWRAFPVPSVSADEPTFCDNMWRGPTWINFNYFLIEGLRRYGYREVAEELRKRTLSEVARWHARDGIIYEYYDSEGATDPIFLRRKALGGPTAKRATASLGTTICDYNFTAALYIDLLQSDGS